MESRDLPDVVKATFGVGSRLSVKLLTSVTLLQETHSASRPGLTSTSAPDTVPSILRGEPQICYFKSQISDPEPRLSRGLGQH